MSRKSSKNKQSENPFPILEAKTEHQKDYIRSIVDNDITFCSGPAGCGKSFISAGIASQHLRSGKTENILVTRPLVSAGGNLGALPGNVKEKVDPYLSPMKEHLRYFLTQKMYGNYANNFAIRFEPLETMRGANCHNTYMILDEAQNCTLKQIKMFLTRMGHNSKVIINGDLKQTDLHNSGLAEAIDRLRSLQGVGIVNMDYSDIQRHPLLAAVLKALD